MRIILTVVEGPHQGQIFTFDGQESFVVGRSKQALFRLPKKDRYISRNHFVVEINAPHCRLMDMGSRNGTFVNDERVTIADLQHEDFIRIGHTLLQVRMENEFEDEADGGTQIVALSPPDPEPFGTYRKNQTAIEPPWDVIAEPQDGAPLLVSASEPSPVDGLASPADLAVNSTTKQELLQAFSGETPQLIDAPLPSTEALANAPAVRNLNTRSSEVAINLQLDPNISSLQPRCPLCDQPWRSDSYQPRRWCDLCAKAIKLLPQICPGYQLVRELGRGTTGVVYQAIREVDHVFAAVRHLQPEETMNPKRRKRFLREMQQLRALRHPGIVSLLEHVEADGQLFLVLEIVRGHTAAVALGREGPFPVARAVHLLSQCLEALGCAHAVGILHREIKPNSILLEQHGGQEQARLMDFGLEWLCQLAHVSRYSLLKGQTETVTWMPPEQIYSLKDVSPASDLYALAASFYTLLTGRTLFSGEDKIEQLLRQILEDEPTPLKLLRPDLPLPLADVLHRALAKDPTARFSSAEEFRLALEPFRQG